MATSEERMKILQMVQEGKITPEEGARLLSALSSSREKRRRRRVGVGTRRSGPRWLRVRVTDVVTGKTKVNVNLPLSLVDAGLSIASHFVDDFDFDEIASAIGEALEGNMSGKIVEVIEGEGGEHVEIFVE